MSVAASGYSLAEGNDENWRQKIGTFRVGIIGANRPILATRQVQPFRQALEKALGVPVEVFSAKDYSTLIEAQLSSRIEYAVYSASAFGAAWSLCKCVRPLVAPVSLDGATGFRSVLIAAKKSSKSLKGLEGKTILIAGKTSFSGYLLPPTTTGFARHRYNL